MESSGGGSDGGSSPRVMGSVRWLTGVAPPTRVIPAGGVLSRGSAKYMVAFDMTILYRHSLV